MYCVKCGKDIGHGAAYCQFCGAQVAPEPIFYTAKPKLVRSRYDKKIAGVCSGWARYFDVDVNIVRIVWLLCFLLGGTGLLAYFICWIVMPEEPAYLPARA